MTKTALAKVVTDESRALARAEDSDGVDELLARFEKIKRVQRAAMKEGTHYGIIPGTDKPALYKPGAEMLCLLFELDPQFSTVERWDGEHLECVVTCTLFHAPTGRRLGSGIGSCTTKESKYAWRNAQRTCPECQKPAIIKGKEEYGGGWVCFKKKNGCGAKFRDGDKAIEGQEVGRVPNPDIADMYNTVRKMACKRAHVAASLFVTGGSALFTQDVEENVHEDPDKPPPIDPHHDVDEDHSPPPAEPNAKFEELRLRLDALERATKSCRTYDGTLGIRAELGSHAKPGPVNKAIQAEREARRMHPDHWKQLNQIWQRVNRQLAKLETSLKPDVTASFADNEPEQGDTGELSEADEERVFQP